MGIKTNISNNSTVIGTGDTVLLSSSALERKAITFCSFHEQTGAGESVELFISTDATSVAGERVDKLVFSPNETKNPISALLSIPANSFLLGKATAGAQVEVNISFTLYDGTDA